MNLEPKKKEQQKAKPSKIQHWMVISYLLAVFDFVSVIVAYSLGLLLRFDFVFSKIPKYYLKRHAYAILIFAAAVVLIYRFCRLYRSMWRFASFNELIYCMIGISVTSFGYFVVSMIWFRMPLSYYLVGALLQGFFTIGIRFSFRFLNLVRSQGKNTAVQSRVLLVGAGSAGQQLIRAITLSGNKAKDKICAIIDDNPNKWGRFIENIEIVGGREEIFNAVEKYHIDKIYIAIPSAGKEDQRDILNICNETGCQLKQLPALLQIVKGEVNVTNLRDVKIDDLLGRDPIRIDMDDVFRFLSGKTVLVTGGGGSIGSEICRQVASHDPKRLIIFDIYENNAYDIQNELKHKYPQLDLVVLIGSVRDSRRITSVFEKYRPDIVYHAAAHKHVPLMEDSPCESIKNNAIGTYKTAYAALKYGAKRFVLISTDKAVNPTNIMGASKRLCEMVIQSFARKVAEKNTADLPCLAEHERVLLGQEGEEERGTQFVAVRFGNVLGSNGSVVPLFKKQIENGGPITVTHPDIIRYFMTVPEAVSLVLQAGTNAKGGEIFVLDMGSPVKIDTLARNLIRLSGLKPDVDIKIEYTGLRPGEKLFEEKLMAEEGLEKTANDLIFIGHPIAFDEDKFISQLEELKEIAYANAEEQIRPAVMNIVNTYHPKTN